jgi:hypothetical protein
MKNWMLLAFGLLVVVVGCGLNSPTTTETSEVEDIFVFTTEQPPVVVGKLVLTADKVGGSRERKVVLGKVPSSPVDMVVSRGELYVNVLSAALTMGNEADYYLNKVVVRSNLPPGVAGRVFQNMQIVVQDAQRGSTLGTLGDPSSMFQLGHQALIPAATTATVRLYVDVANNPSIEDLRAVNEIPEGPFTLLYVEIVNARTWKRIRSQGIVQQRLYVSPNIQGCTGPEGFSTTTGESCRE